MGVRTTSSEKRVALFDSVTGWAFGPTFATEDEAEDFLRYTAYGPDLRGLDEAVIEGLYKRWLAGKPMGSVAWGSGMP